MERSYNGVFEEGERLTFVLLEGRENGHGPFGEAVAAIALRAEAGLAPEDEVAEFPLGVIVGGLDACNLGKGEESLLVLQDVLAGAGHTSALQRDELVEHSVNVQFGLGDDHTRELFARHRAVADTVPVVEHALCDENQAVAEVGDGLVGVLLELGELAKQMGPADLSLLHRPEGELLAAVRHQDAGEAADESAQGLGRAVGHDREHRGQAARVHPESALCSGLSPRGGVEVLGVGSIHSFGGLAIGSLEQVRDSRLGVADGAQGQRDAQDVGEHLLHLSAAHLVAGDEERDERHEVRTDHAARYSARKLGARHAAAVGALDGVQDPLRDVGHDPGDLDHLVNERLAVRELGQAALATAASGREAVCAAGRGQQLASVAFVPGLAAGGLGGRLSARPLVAHARRVARRRLSGVRRVAAKFGKERLDPRIPSSHRLAKGSVLRLELRHAGLESQQTLFQRTHTASRSCS